MLKVRKEMRILYSIVIGFFVLFLFSPLVIMLLRSFHVTDGGVWSNYISVLQDHGMVTAIFNSLKVSSLAAFITTLIVFVLAYAVHCTNMGKTLKKVVRVGILVPMLLPTITYGFAIIYSFGNQGLLTRLFGQEWFSIYGFNGLLMGYVVYTIPPAFLIIHNAFYYIDRKFIVVSKLMGDGYVRSFIHTIFYPLIGSLGGAFVLSFILSFTDFGIPASIGGTYSVVATQLYQVMLGAIPNFNHGAAIAVLMLVPSMLGLLLLGYLKKFQFHYDSFSEMNVTGNKLRDGLFSIVTIAVIVGMMSIFAIMFIAPFVQGYPYDLTFTLAHFREVLSSNTLLGVYFNSVLVAVLTASIGTIIAYVAALLHTRTKVKGRFSLDLIFIICNTVPGMVLGLSYLLLFNQSTLKGTLFIIVACTIVHYFTTPYLMAKNALSKMNPAWEATAGLLGDSWGKTVFRVVLPNSVATISEMFSYYFINAMVTISGIIFLVSPHTEMIASKINELQHFAQFNEIFVLSLLLFFTNLTVKLLCDYLQKNPALNLLPFKKVRRRKWSHQLKKSY